MLGSQILAAWELVDSSWVAFSAKVCIPGRPEPLNWEGTLNHTTVDNRNPA